MLMIIQIVASLLIFSVSAVDSTAAQSRARKELFIWYNLHYDEYTMFQKYLHGIHDGYFLELGGLDPVYHSNTVGLANWKGIVVQANQMRSINIRDYEFTGVQSLNFAMMNESGKMVTFYEVTNEDEASSISKGAVVGKPTQQFPVMTINLADLCHKYYKRKPHFMSIDVEGVGQSVLRSNDWDNPKCVPDLIYAQYSIVNIKAGQTQLKQYLAQHKYNYLRMPRNRYNYLFIHDSKVAQYEKLQRQNQEHLNKISQKQISWTVFKTLLVQILGKHAQNKYDIKTEPYYVHIRQRNIIDIVDINNHSNSVSLVGTNRPILIMNYDQKISKINLPSKQYTVQDVVLKSGFDIYLKKIKTTMDNKELLIYVVDHEKYDRLDLVFVQEKVYGQDSKIVQISSQGKVSQQSTGISNQNETPKSLQYTLDLLKNQIKRLSDLENSFQGQRTKLLQQIHNLNELLNKKSNDIVSTSSSSSQLLISAFTGILVLLTFGLTLRIYMKNKSHKKYQRIQSSSQTSAIDIIRN